MRVVFATLLFSLFYASPGLAESMPTSFQQDLQVNGDKVTVYLASSGFTPETLDIDLSAPWQIDGSYPLGGFPAKPARRMESFHLTWGGKRFDIPPEYYRDCFDPNLRPRQGWWHNQGGVMVRPSDNGDSVAVEMEVSQIACCGYQVTWIIDNNGRVTRFVDRTIP